MSLYKHASSEAISKSHFHLALSGFQYLGINTPNLEDLFKVIYPPFNHENESEFIRLVDSS